MRSGVWATRSRISTRREPAPSLSSSSGPRSSATAPMRITWLRSCGRNCAAAWERAPMISRSTPCIDRMTSRRIVVAALTLFACLAPSLPAVRADALARANAAYARGDFIGAVHLLTPLALHGKARAQAFLGFMDVNGYGAPQVYVAAADLYLQAAISGNSFGQGMLGLMYDKGHGVPQDFVLAYKW